MDLTADDTDNPDFLPGFFLAGKMNIAFESSGLDGKMKALFEKFNETVKAVVRRLVAAINQRVGTIYGFGLGLVVGQPRNVRVVLPKGGARCSHSGRKLTWIPMMQIADRRSQHHNVFW